MKKIIIPHKYQINKQCTWSWILKEQTSNNNLIYKETHTSKKNQIRRVKARTQVDLAYDEWKWSIILRMWTRKSWDICQCSQQRHACIHIQVNAVGADTPITNQQVSCVAVIIAANVPLSFFFLNSSTHFYFIKQKHFLSLKG